MQRWVEDDSVLVVTSVVLGGCILRRFLFPTQPLSKDDLPLFTMTMCDATVNRHAMSQFNPEMDLVMGDLRIETPAFGRTLDSYRTILGLAPSVSTSLQARVMSATQINTNVKHVPSFLCLPCGKFRVSFESYASLACCYMISL